MKLTLYTERLHGPDILKIMGYLLKLMFWGVVVVNLLFHSFSIVGEEALERDDQIETLAGTNYVLPIP